MCFKSYYSRIEIYFRFYILGWKGGGCFVSYLAMQLFVCSIYLIYDFLAGNNYPDSPHLQGVWNLPHKFHLYLILFTFFYFILNILLFEIVLKGSLETSLNQFLFNLNNYWVQQKMLD